MGERFRILVVCEGPTDFEIIKKVVETVDPHEKLELSLLEPVLDATSGGFERYGWGGVERWCRKYAVPPKLSNLMAFSDCLLIQLDADIASQINLPNQQMKNSIPGRKAWCGQAIDYWLGVNRKTFTKPVVHLVPAWQMETWLLATYDQRSSPGVFSKPIANYESMKDVEPKLIALGYEEDRNKPGRLFKTQQLYQGHKYAPRITSHLTPARQRCPELEKFLSFVERHV